MDHPSLERQNAFTGFHELISTEECFQLSKMEDPRKLYNLLLSQVFQLMFKYDTRICSNNVLKLVDSPNISWQLLARLTQDLKMVLLTLLSRDTSYMPDTIAREAKKFLSPEDYMDTLEKIHYFRCSSQRNYFDICSCGECDFDVIG